MSSLTRAVLVAMLLFCASPAFADDADLASLTKRIEDSVANEKDLTALTEIISKQPGNAKAHYALGEYLEWKGYEQLAADSFSKAIECDPGLGLAHYRRCQLLFRFGEIANATKEVATCEKLLSGDGEKLFQLGLALEHAGKKEEAKRLFKLATLAGHKGQGYGANLAQIRLYQGKLTEALEAVEWDLNANKNDPHANGVKAVILERLGREDEAMQCLITAAKGAPCEDSAAAKTAQKLIKKRRYKDALGIALLDLLCTKYGPKAMDSAKQTVEDLLVKVPDKEGAEVIQSLSAELEKSRGCRFFRLALGDIYDRLNRRQRAIDQYQLAMRNCPSALADDRTASRGWYRLGHDYEVYLRNYREARNLYQIALALAPEDPQIKRDYTRLSRRMANRRNDVACHIKDSWNSFWLLIWPVRPY